MSSQKNTNEYPRVTTKQLKAMARISLLIQELFNEANATQLGPKLGVSPQALQKHIDTIKKGIK